MATVKTSISLPREELAAAKKAAAAAGVSLSVFLGQLVRAHGENAKRAEAMGVYLEHYAPNFRLTERMVAEVDAEERAPLRPVRPRRRRKAA